MNVLNTLIWTLIYTSLIYRKNVVYCSENSTDQSSSSPGSQPASTTPPATPPANQQSGSTSTSVPIPQNLSSKENDQDDSAESPKPGSKIHIFIENPKDSTKNIELNLSKIVFGDINKFQFVDNKLGDDVKCTEVKYKDESVWKFDSTKSEKHPKSVIWHECYYLVFLEFDDHYRFFSKGSDNKWKWEGMRNTGLLDETKVKLYTQEGSNFKELGSDQYDFNDLAFAYEFILKDGTKCALLSYDGAPIFNYNSKHDNGNYPSVIYIFSNRSGQVFYPKASFPLDSPINIVLNLKDTTSGTNKFDYSKNDKIVTYTAKSGYGIIGVNTKVKGDGNCTCCQSKNKRYDIWKAKEVTEYATKVVLDGKGNNTKTVTIHMANGIIKKFKKNGRNKPWNEQQVPQNQQASVNTGAATTTPAAPKAEGAHLTGQSAGGDGTTGTAKPAEGNDQDASSNDNEQKE